MSLVFDRNYGVGHLPTTTGDIITTISQPDWEAFIGKLAEFTQCGQQIGSLILSPELITSTDIDHGSVADLKTVIEDRVNEATSLTAQIPEATLLLGTVVFDETTVKPRNALVFLKNGIEVGRTHKVTPLGLPEREAFHLSANLRDIQKPKPNTMVIICSDLIEHPYIDDEVVTLLVSGCWGVPTSRPGWTASPDHRLARGIELSTEELFARHTNLETIVMTDRVPTPSTVKGPFNFIARRRS